MAWTFNPWAAVRHFHRHRELLLQMTWREVQLRYHGSWLGPLWSLLTPLMMLGVYTFVFAVVFQTRWATGAGDSRLQFALALFVSLAAFNVFAETVSAAPGLIINHRNYVKRVVFPLEVLPVAKLLANLVQAGLSFLVFLIAWLVLRGLPGATWLFLPVVLLPMVLWTLGCSFLLASLGVFIRDLGQVVGLVVTMLLFMSAIFYPLASLPAAWQPALALNPLASVVEDVRRVTLEGLAPHWGLWAMTSGLGLLLSGVGLAWFMKSKHAFADVL